MTCLIAYSNPQLPAPEVSALIHSMPDLRRKIQFITLWNTRARISEALALPRRNLLLRQQYSVVRLATLKQRESKADRRARRLPAAAVPHRLVPLSDAQYVNQLEMMIATLRIPLERRSEIAGGRNGCGHGSGCFASICGV